MRNINNYLLVLVIMLTVLVGVLIFKLNSKPKECLYYTFRDYQYGAIQARCRDEILLFSYEEEVQWKRSK